MIDRPNEDEYFPLVKKYIDLVPDSDIVGILVKQMENHLQLLSNITNEKGNFRYEPGKWSVKEVIGHIADVERLWNYRILRMSRGDIGILSGYDRDRFVEYSGHHQLPLTAVLNDYKAVRESSLSLIRNLTEDSLIRTGNFNDHELSVRACTYIIAGHELHHINILKTRYLS